MFSARLGVSQHQSWVTDITYIRTHEGWLYLSVVIDLFSRQVVGWSVGHRIDTELVLNALLMALWRCQPKATVTVHSDQGSQFTSHDRQGFLRDHNLVFSMSRRGNCHDNAVAESFFQLLKRGRIRRQIYSTRDEARTDVFNYIEMFYNPRRRHNRRRLVAGRVRATPFPTAQKCLGKPGRFIRLAHDLCEHSFKFLHGHFGFNVCLLGLRAKTLRSLESSGARERSCGREREARHRGAPCRRLGVQWVWRIAGRTWSSTTDYRGRLLRSR